MKRPLRSVRQKRLKHCSRCRQAGHSYTTCGGIVSGIKFEDISRLYAKGLSTRTVARRFGISQGSICKAMIKMKIPLRDRSISRRRYSLNEAAFDAPLSEEALYWAGFLMADGGIVGTATVLQLQKRDIGHVRKFKAFLGYGGKILDRKGPNQGRLSVKSVRLVKRLAELGIVPRKSLIAKAPEELKNNRDFWRGVVDGDGSVGDEGRISVGIIGSLYLVPQFAAFINKSIGSNIKSRLTKRVACTGTMGANALRALRLLYRNARVSLERKYQAYLRIEARVVLAKCRTCRKEFESVHSGHQFCSVDCQRHFPWRRFHAEAIKTS